MTLVDYKSIPVVELIPHSPPMVLIDRIIDYRDNDLVAEITISPESMFFDQSQKGVPSWVGIEYMAQTIAALAGIRALEEGEEMKLGFLLGTRRYETVDPIMAVGKTFQIQVRQLIKDDSGLACFDCKIACGNELVCEARLNVFEAKDLQTLEEKARHGKPS